MPKKESPHTPTTTKPTGTPEPEKKYVRAEPVGSLRKHLTTTEVARPVFDERRPPTAPVRGPMTGEASLSDAKFVENFATETEMSAFRHAIEERRAKDPTAWRWFRCDHCSASLRAKLDTEAGSSCPMCNFRNREDLGHLQPMTAVEVDYFLKKKGAEDEAAIERNRRSAFNAENETRAKYGMEPRTYTDFLAQRMLEFRAKLERERGLNERMP